MPFLIIVQSCADFTFCKTLRIPASLTFARLPSKQQRWRQQLPNTHQIQSLSRAESPQRKGSSTLGVQFHPWISSENPPSLAFPYVLTALSNLDSISCHNIEQRWEGKKKKKRVRDYLKPLCFFWWAIDFGRRILWRGGEVTGVHLCMPVRGPGPPAPFCSDACMQSLAWLE